jgi:hypothetical protein
MAAEPSYCNGACVLEGAKRERGCSRASIGIEQIPIGADHSEAYRTPHARS